MLQPQSIKRRVLIELAHNRDLASSAFAAGPASERGLDVGSVPQLSGVEFDSTCAPTAIPGLRARTAFDAGYVSGRRFDLALEPTESTYVVRAELEEGRIEETTGHSAVRGVYADVEIQPALICPSSGPMGTDADVARLLCVPQMSANGMDGSGVLMAIVDTGFNLAYLAGKGKVLNLDRARSWVPAAGMTPGDAPVSHGTMCAFDAAIAAPKATFLDIQLLRSTATGVSPMAGLLSDGVRAFDHLIRIMTAPRRPGETRSLVVSNSWGMFHPSWDLPVGNAGNYSDNPNHPFNRIVAALEAAGADILFAAGNCGRDCPDGRCSGVTSNAIYGANGHSAVITVAGVDITSTRVGYSTQGPGRLAVNKPDIAAFTHFQGSGVYPADGGTSAATPVAAGVVAALRTKRPYVPGNPAVTPIAVRNLLRTTAEDKGGAGFDFDYGFGVIDGCELSRGFRPLPGPAGICVRYPRLCRELPHRFRAPGPFPVPDREPWRGGGGPILSGTGDEPSELEDLIATVFKAGYHEGQKASGTTEATIGEKKHADCGCGGKGRAQN